MPLFWKPYQSTTSKLIAELKQKNPSLEDQQRQGRALLWDQAIDRQAQSQFQACKVTQQAYVYQTQNHTSP